GGCGTTEACRTCGAVAAVLAAQSGRTVIRDCSIGITDATAADLRIKASPFGVGGRNFTLIAIQDIADQKRREVLERAFFHDILNVAGGIQGIAILLEATESTAELQEYVPMLTFTTEQLVEEIKCQRDLVAAESGDLDTITSRTNSLQILREVTETYRHDAEGAGHSVVIDPDSSETGLEVSHVLLVRVLGNMIRNALEASTGEAGIRTGCRRDEDHIEFWVWNDDVMAQEVQMQIFRRSFSTKGVGRGIGTYSMKLLTERYLGGEISFVSAAGRGTEFRLRLPLGPPAS
ncbi:histidine kinase, partial [bacterium]